MEERFCNMVKEMGCTCVTISHRPALVAFHDMVSLWLQMRLEPFRLPVCRSSACRYGRHCLCAAQASQAAPSTVSMQDGPSAAGWTVISQQAAKAIGVQQTLAA